MAVFDRKVFGWCRHEFNIWIYCDFVNQKDKVEANYEILIMDRLSLINFVKSILFYRYICALAQAANVNFSLQMVWTWLKESKSMKLWLIEGGPWWTDQLGLKIEIASHRSLKQNKAYPTSKQLYAARLLRDGSLPKERCQAFLFDIFHRWNRQNWL